MDAKFLLVTDRTDPRIRYSEYEDFLRFSGLTADSLEWRRIDDRPLGQVRLNDYQGVIVGGSPADLSAKVKDEKTERNEADLRKLVAEVIEEDKPYLGICYGLSLLVAESGGKVDYSISEQMGPARITLSEPGRTDPLLAGVDSEFHAYLGHHESVIEVAPGTLTLATGEVAPYQMIRYKQNLYGTQFHPELDLEAILLRVEAYQHNGYFAPEEKPKVEEAVRKAPVNVVHQILRNFVRHFGLPN